MTYPDGLVTVPLLTHFRLEGLDGAAELLIAGSYFIIGTLITLSIWRNRHGGVDGFGVNTTALFFSCALGHTAHGTAILGLADSLSWQFRFDLVTLIPAIAFLSFHRNYSWLVQFSRILKSNTEVEQLNKTLEQQVECRTQELRQQNERLKETMTELKRVQMHLVQTEKMSMLGQMIAGISHEINNPINFIYGNLPYIEEQVQDLFRVVEAYQTSELHHTPAMQRLLEEVELDFVFEDLPRAIESIKLGSERIRELVLNLRYFYRLDEVQMKPADLHAGIESTLLLLHNRYKQKIEVICQFGEIPLIECHINQLNQVFMNLICNAIDALMEEIDQDRHKQIVITTQLIDSDWVVVKISDNGVGINPEVQLRLFEPFFTTKPIGIGTGLGLSISHQIVTDTHQGRISCLSTLGEGTTFIVELPVCQTHKSEIEISLHPAQTCYQS